MVVADEVSPFVCATVAVAVSLAEFPIDTAVEVSLPVTEVRLIGTQYVNHLSSEELAVPFKSIPEDFAEPSGHEIAKYSRLPSHCEREEPGAEYFLVPNISSPVIDCDMAVLVSLGAVEELLDCDGVVPGFVCSGI